ncbi:MAG: 30S ribosomal protein S6, partial [Dehalococcoidia bacterium]
FDELDQVAEEAGLSQGARDRLAKARRVKPRMQATIDFFWTTVLAWFTKWCLSPPVAKLMREILIPVCYLRLAARRLAYPIQDFREANYMVTQFTFDPSLTVELETNLKSSGEIIRYLLVKKETKP